MIKLMTPVNFTGGTLIIPSVCVGNVAQLSVDLIIETLKMKKVGIIWHPALIPIIGPPAYWQDFKDTTTSAGELFVHSDENSPKLSVLQIRSPLVASLMQDFFANLMEFIEKEKFKEVIILSSCYAHEKHTIQESPFVYRTTNENHKDKLDSLKWQSYSATDASFPHILGGGFASQLFRNFEERNIPSMILFKYVSEGDNAPDAREMVIKLNEFLEFLPKKEDGSVRLTIPPSWKFLFGNCPPQSMF
ncbi:Proteasome assembly chaperone 2 [Sergentomyia squamirostris]